MNMISKKQFIELIDFQIHEVSQFCWSCYGKNAFYMDWYSDPISPATCKSQISAIMDLVTDTVYEVSVWDYRRENFYVYYNPDFRDAYAEEAGRRGITEELIILETLGDFLDKASAIIEGVEYDTRVSIDIELPQHTMFTLMSRAHEHDMTFNDYLSLIIRQEMDQTDLTEIWNK